MSDRSVSTPQLRRALEKVRVQQELLKHALTNFSATFLLPRAHTIIQVAGKE
jgi:hypothetical protein